MTKYLGGIARVFFFTGIPPVYIVQNESKTINETTSNSYNTLPSFDSL